MAAFAQSPFRCFALFCALLLAAFGAGSAAQAAQPFETELQPCVKAALPGETAEQLVHHPALFDCSTPQNQLPSGDYWVRLDGRHIASDLSDPLMLRTVSVWMGDQDITAFYTDGTSYHLFVPVSETSHYLRLGTQLEYPLAQHQVPLAAILVRVNAAANVRGVMLAPKLVSTSASTRDERNNAAYYSAFAGLCLALLVYNLALWRGMKSPFQLAYGAMVVSLLFYAFTSSGGAAYYFDELTNQDRLRINYVLLSLAAATALIFLRHFLEDNILPGWFIRAVWVQAFLVVIASAVFATFAPQSIKLLDRIYFLSFVPLPLFYFGAVYFGWRGKSRYVPYLLVAWSAPVAVAIARSLHGLGYLPYNFLLDNGSLIAMGFEAMVSSMAIGQRIRGIMRDRDLAIAAERVANDLADKDALTGLLNRRALLRELLKEPRDWQLVLIDIDHFKRVNDTLGHSGGDDVLVRVTQAIRAVSPARAHIARLGGEEFAIATIANADDNMLTDPAKILKAVRQTDMPGGYRVTASVGVARRVICEEQDWKILYRAADMALYRAKAEGRDRHVDYSAERIAA
jgi:diguanylate cyclase (GGDEF)-like protein